MAPDRLARALSVFGPVFTQFYGLSETPMPLTCMSAPDHQRLLGSASLGSAGRPSAFVEIKLVDAQGREVPAGAEGEILVRGDSVMSGYWSNPEATVAMITADGWAHTGDVGRFDEGGYLHIVDRIKDLIITGGYNVYPTEVENAILSLESVLEVAVVGVPDEQWGEAIKAVVVARPGFDLDAERVVTACRERLADYKKPRSVEFVSALPKTGSGKLMRRKVRDEYWHAADRQV
jgi:acyl-CoA synthetase (AMP-forming)/AMP-acid ligase II